MRYTERRYLNFCPNYKALKMHKCGTTLFVTAVCVSCTYLANLEISSRKCEATDINICYFYPILTKLKFDRHI